MTKSTQRVLKFGSWSLITRKGATSAARAGESPAVATTDAASTSARSLERQNRLRLRGITDPLVGQIVCPRITLSQDHPSSKSPLLVKVPSKAGFDVQIKRFT